MASTFYWTCQILFLIGLSMCDNRHLLVDKLRLDFMKLEEHLWRFVLWEAPNTGASDAEYYVTNEFFKFEQTLRQMPDDVMRGTEPVRNIHAFPLLYSEIKHTENLYEKFYLFHQQQIQLRKTSFKDKKALNDAIDVDYILRDILDVKTGTNATVHKIYDLTFGEENMGGEVIQLLLRRSCVNYNQSPQQMYYNLYNTIALSGLKSYIMTQFAYLVKRISERGNYTDLSEISRAQFEKRVNVTMTFFRGFMQIGPREFWQCDPPKYIQGETYEQFTRLLQGHIQNEVDMNKGGTCREDCDAYPLTTSHGCYDSDSKYCRETERCNGKILNCRFFESHMNICPSQIPSRRYDYIEYESGKTLGPKTGCWKKPIDSWWRWLVHCSYCFCLCDEQGPNSDRYISLRPVLANVENNRVVTGLKFVKRNRIMHLQIQEGKLLPYGYIDNTTVHWVDVDEFKITDKGIYNLKDYYTMTYESRDMALDDVEVKSSNFIVTGVHFQFINGKIRFQIYAHQFDWETGSLVLKSGSEVIFNKQGGKNKINIQGADVPIKFTNSEMDYRTEDPYIEFTHTDIEADAAQTTIPFFDIQKVSNEPQVPLMGAGIYFKNKDSSGGFIAPKIKTYDYSQLVLVEFPNFNTKKQVKIPVNVISN